MAEKQPINKIETSCSLIPQRSAEELCDVLKGRYADCETSECLSRRNEVWKELMKLVAFGVWAHTVCACEAIKELQRLMGTRAQDEPCVCAWVEGAHTERNRATGIGVTGVISFAELN